MMNYPQMYDYVMERALLNVTYDEATTEQQDVYRVLQFYSEMASGGFEGYIGWVLELLTEEQRKQSVEQLTMTLLEIGCKYMAQVVATHAWSLYMAAQSLQHDEITEDDYVEELVVANDSYYAIEQQFAGDMQTFIAALYYGMKIGE